MYLYLTIKNAYGSPEALQSVSALCKHSNTEGKVRKEGTILLGIVFFSDEQDDLIA